MKKTRKWKLDMGHVDTLKLESECTPILWHQEIGPFVKVKTNTGRKLFRRIKI